MEEATGLSQTTVNRFVNDEWTRMYPTTRVSIIEFLKSPRSRRLPQSWALGAPVPDPETQVAGKAAPGREPRRRYRALAEYELSVDVLLSTFGNAAAVQVFRRMGLLPKYVEAVKEIAASQGYSAGQLEEVGQWGTKVLSASE